VRLKGRLEGRERAREAGRMVGDHHGNVAAKTEERGSAGDGGGS
jgi:hypothetical protein